MKTGVYSITKFLLSACRVFVKYSAAFTAAVEASPLTSSEQATVISVITSVNAACAILKKLFDSSTA